MPFVFFDGGREPSLVVIVVVVGAGSVAEGVGRAASPVFAAAAPASF
jgi:hypothetical protein